MRRFVILGASSLLLALLLFLSARPHFYFFRQVKEDQIGVKIRGGQIVDIVPPGVYHDVGLFVRMDTYSTQEYKFQSSDPEVITADNQRLGVTVSGSVFRPGLADVQRVKSLWTQYKLVYTSNEAIQKVMDDLSQQAMKVCVGDKPFSESVVGSDRDALRSCIAGELDKLTEPYGLTIANLVVPNVQLSAEVQAKLDAITQSRLDTEKAQQDEKKAIAEGKARQAEQEADIRVEQSRKQEETRQQTALAQLDQAKLLAQKVVIDAQKANDLLSAQKDLEIAKAQAAAAAEKAKADLANEIALAALYAEHPEYLQMQIALANASALKETDKVIFTPSGVSPQLILSSGVLPTISVANPEGPTSP